ncbi:hypothetical protein OG339_07560 [Streptosporangium sp. NBC_01495]|uniref:prenyltransferase/squalene oxidase repeat-containing protein n=1 Tax=Streptosporangium sp. NBC_01495 TaxID=2903899 RepID=UPI002E2F0B66|nr:prenyltransferase/squalene oxidase repeat-containing protein [Streptosporangium sp. NBC_01495]
MSTLPARREERHTGVPEAERHTYAELMLPIKDEDGECFLVELDEHGHPVLPKVRLEKIAGTDELPGIVSREVRNQLDLEVGYLGLLTFEGIWPSLSMTVVASVQTAPPGSRFKSLNLSEVKARSMGLRHRELFETAHRWYEAERSAVELIHDVGRSFDSALNLLSHRRSTEGDRQGWEQYFRANSIGTLSTADGILAALHAGAGYELIEKPLEALRGLQTPAGGWGIRRSLVGTSDIPITECTCACLWAFHKAGLRPENEPAVREGIAWLERTQRPDGGWSSSDADVGSLVFPTASAVRVLALFKRSEIVDQGIAWLRGAQRNDGGWGAVAENVTSSPAFTAAAVLALSSAGVAADDDAVKEGCAYLIRTFSSERPDPWEATSSNSLVDTENHARMVFRHFATPWALAALCVAGHDLSHPVVLAATRQLLRLQKQPAGTWPCGHPDPDPPTVWAVHDAVHALRAVIDSSTRNPAPLIRDRYVAAERRTMTELAVSLLGQDLSGGESSGGPPRQHRNWISTLWLSLLTVAVALIGLEQLGILEKLQSSSGLSQVGAALAAFVVTSVGALAPTIAAEEYRIRRSQSKNRQLEKE